MNKITKLFLFIFLFSYSLNAQLVVGESGSIEVKNGASIEVAGLEISPAADYVINGSTSVISDLAPLTINGAESMDRHYDIVAPLSDFIGTIVFNYNEEDMNGISHEADLQVLDSEGGSWMNYADTDDFKFRAKNVKDIVRRKVICKGDYTTWFGHFAKDYIKSYPKYVSFISKKRVIKYLNWGIEATEYVYAGKDKEAGIKRAKTLQKFIDQLENMQ